MKNENNFGRLVNDNEIKEIEIELLHYLKKVCDLVGIRFYLTYGTLLGAVRHSGFIPWDDDIDVMVTREDYYRLIEAIKKYPHEHYKFISHDIDSKYSLPLAKLYDNRTKLYENYGSITKKVTGVYIDIFIADYIPDDRRNGENFFKGANRLRFMYALSTRKIEKKKGVLWSIGRNALVIPFKLIGFDAFIKKYDRYCKKYFTNKTSHVGITMFGEGNWDKERILVENLSGRTKLKFEDERYYVPDNYHQYLTQLYGEYMQLPPVDQRVTKHCFKAYWGIGDKEYGK